MAVNFIELRWWKGAYYYCMAGYYSRPWGRTRLSFCTVIQSRILLLCIAEERRGIVKPVYNGYSKIDKTKIFITNGSLMKVKRIAECFNWSILQYFWPALSDNWCWKPICGLFESGHFTQVLLCVICYF